MSFAAITVGLGVVAAGTNIYSSIKQGNAANQIKPEYHEYKESPYAKEKLDLAKSLFFGRTPGALQQERNIAASQGNFNNFIGRNATDSGQALALGGLSQGATNNAFNQLGIQESQSKLGYLDNLNDAYRSMIGEGDKVFDSQMNRYLTDVQAKTALRNASAQNLSSGINQLGSSAFLANQQFYPDSGIDYSKMWM